MHRERERDEFWFKLPLELVKAHATMMDLCFKGFIHVNKKMAKLLCSLASLRGIKIYGNYLFKKIVNTTHVRGST